MSDQTQNQQKMLMLSIMSVIMPLTFATWQVLLNNFAIEQAAYTGADIGLLQSVREIPGFLAFTAVLVLLLIREQQLAVLSLALLSIGVALTGFFPSSVGLLATTFIMSVGFHYFETLRQSLILQWIDKASTPAFMGKLLSIGSMTSLVVYGCVFLFVTTLEIDYEWLYLGAGSIGLMLVIYLKLAFPNFESPVEQNKKLFLRRRYWLFYLLTFLSGARRQIFMVFAGFLMVEKFGFSVADISLLYLINHLINLYAAPRIGQWIGKIGERRALLIEYSGLILVFSGYAMVQTAEMAAFLYVVDHIFFAMAIAIKTYFQKIADPADIAATSGVSFTINHIAAVIIPASFGLIWLVSPSMVFWLGAVIASMSLLSSRLIPEQPEPGNEVTLPVKQAIS